MIFEDGKAKDIKIAYIGGGSRGWARGFMSDLVSHNDISGSVYLYDIDEEAMMNNQKIGMMFNDCEGAQAHWDYFATESLKEALEGADFVVISILPGTFDEMEADVHMPEKYGIYQSVGDTSGPGGIVRAMRTVPMYEEFAKGIKAYCPDAWVINYTNPMTLCTKTLFRVFPEIKAFGCCHEVFGTQKLLSTALDEICGIKDVPREEIKTNVVSVNHFTWLTSAKYKNMDLVPVYEKFIDKYYETGYTADVDKNWMNRSFHCTHRVKMDLYKRYGYIAAAGDRHLAEFCEGKWYLKDPETVEKWGFGLTTVEWRKNDLKRRYKSVNDILTGEEIPHVHITGEDGVNQLRALCGLCEMVTNVNIPNKGQIPNLPIGAVVETNAAFRADSVEPIFAGEIPAPIYPLVSRICGEQENLDKAMGERNVAAIFNEFANDPLTTCSYEDARKLFIEMTDATSEYLTDYDLESFKSAK